MTKSRSVNEASTNVFMYLSLIVAVLLFAFAGLAAWANHFAGGMVKTELSAQKIYFPELGSPALDPAEFPDLQKYAGQQVDSPEEAKAYANGFIARHLEKIGGGKTYSEVSAEAMKDPTNTTLQQQKQTLFQGETLRGVLLTSGYGFGMIGKIAGVAATIAVVLGIAMLGMAAYLRTRL